MPNVFKELYEAEEKKPREERQPITFDLYKQHKSDATFEDYVADFIETDPGRNIASKLGGFVTRSEGADLADRLFDYLPTYTLSVPMEELAEMAYENRAQLEETQSKKDEEKYRKVPGTDEKMIHIISQEAKVVCAETFNEQTHQFRSKIEAALREKVRAAVKEKEGAQGLMSEDKVMELLRNNYPNTLKTAITIPIGQYMDTKQMAEIKDLPTQKFNDAILIMAEGFRKPLAQMNLAQRWKQEKDNLIILQKDLDQVAIKLADENSKLSVSQDLFKEAKLELLNKYHSQIAGIQVKIGHSLQNPNSIQLGAARNYIVEIKTATDNVLKDAILHPVKKDFIKIVNKIFGGLTDFFRKILEKDAIATQLTTGKVVVKGEELKTQSVNTDKRIKEMEESVSNKPTTPHM